MRRPGTRIRRLAERWCRSKTLEHLVDPILADIQTEYDAAVRLGHMWQARQVWVAGYVALFKALAWHGGNHAVEILLHGGQNDDRTLGRSVVSSVAAICVATAVVEAISFLSYVSGNHPQWARLAIYLVPQAVPVAVPVGLAFGILWALGGTAVPARTRLLVFTLALACSVGSFFMLDVVMPDANQAFRVSLVGHQVPRGANELTLAEITDRLERGPFGGPAWLLDDNTRAHLAFTYHTRWALACAPLVLTVFALAAARNSRRRRTALLAGSLVAASYVLAISGTGPTLDLPAAAVAWIPNAATLLLALAIIATRRAARRSTDSAL